VTWNVTGKGITGLSWHADPSSTGSPHFTLGGVNFSKAQKSGTAQSSFTMGAGTGKADVTATGFAVAQSNTVTCTLPPPPQPDLTITAITQDPNNASWDYTATVKNIGGATADLTNVAVQGYYTASTDVTQFPPLGGVPPSAGGDAAGGSLIPPQLATSLAPGASVVVPLGSGGPTLLTDNELMVGVDVDNVLAESNENNNVSVVPRITVPPPDLTITNISFTPLTNLPWSYTVTVKNIGSGPANVSQVAVQGAYTASTDTSTFPPSGQFDWACSTIMQPFATTLAAGASVDVQVGCANGPPVATETQLMVGVNVGNQQVIQESDLTNNVAVVPVPPAFTVSPTSYDFGSVALGGIGVVTYVDVTTGNDPIVIDNPSVFSPDTVVNGVHIFGDTQGGSCWQSYEVHGNPIPAHTTCNIAVAFHPQDAIAYAATMTVYQCATTQVFQNGVDQSINCLETELTGVDVALSGTGT
jgi:hypothetical protein